MLEILSRFCYNFNISLQLLFINQLIIAISEVMCLYDLSRSYKYLNQARPQCCFSLLHWILHITTCFLFFLPTCSPDPAPTKYSVLVPSQLSLCPKTLRNLKRYLRFNFLAGSSFISPLTSWKYEGECLLDRSKKKPTLQIPSSFLFKAHYAKKPFLN